jgi:enoyl-CoA hydratase/carnithine racemase
MANYQHVLVGKEGKIASLTVNRAEKFNTFGPDVWRESCWLVRKLWKWMILERL